MPVIKNFLYFRLLPIFFVALFILPTSFSENILSNFIIGKFFLAFFSLLYQHFGWSVAWFVFAILFLSRKNKIIIKIMFFFFIPLGISSLAGILWVGYPQTLSNYFGVFALFSQQLFDNLFLQIFLLCFYSYSLYLIISHYQLHSFWKLLWDYIPIFLQKFFLNKKIDKRLEKIYTIKVLKKFLIPQRSSEKEKIQKNKDIKRIPTLPESSWQADSSDSSLNELLSVFHSFNSQKKK